MELESIGRNIRKFRLMRNLRQEDLAEMAGLSINYVGALERGEKIPSLETFIVLLNALEVSSDTPYGVMTPLPSSMRSRAVS